MKYKEVTLTMSIPEWLRRKMGLTDEKNISDSDKRAYEEELKRLDDAVRMYCDGLARYSLLDDEHRSEDRG